MMRELFTISEDDVAAGLGVTREAVRELRTEHLYENEDFGVVKRQIMLSEAGVQKIREFLQKNAPPGARRGDLALPKGNTPPAEKKRAAAIVSRIFPKNKGFLEAMLDLDAITVRVRCNENFLPGMELEGLLPAGGRLYDYTGRLPRRKGVW
jgi:hypothetical protein